MRNIKFKINNKISKTHNKMSKYSKNNLQLPNCKKK
jgi:hypothetical protein